MINLHNSTLLSILSGDIQLSDDIILDTNDIESLYPSFPQNRMYEHNYF